MPPDVVFRVRDFAAAQAIFRGAPGTVRLADEHTAHWRPPKGLGEGLALVRQLLKQLTQAEG